MPAMFAKNVGSIDRILRIVVGLGLISLVYTLIGIRTCPIGNK
jgi:hypothetical protein